MVIATSSEMSQTGSSLPPLELKDFLQKREPSLLERERRTLRSCFTSPKAIAYKNLLGVSVSYWIIFGAFLAVIGLQSSLNEELGLASLSLLYGIFFFSGFYTSAVVSLLGTKITLLICYIIMLLYTVSNYYPSWYTLIAGSVIYGLGNGPLWTSLNVHVTTVARHYSNSTNDTAAYLISLFIGIFTMFVKLGYIPANVASSVILLLRSSSTSDDRGHSNYSSSLNDTVCTDTEASEVSDESLYIILSVDVFFGLLAIIILVMFVDHLGTKTRLHSFGKMFSLYFKEPFIATLKMFIEWKMLMILPMMAFDGFAISFTLGAFSRYYVSSCIGVQWVGLGQMTFGIFSAFTAVLNGRLVKIVPQYIMVYITILINIGLIVFFLIWERRPSFPAVFLGLTVWGMCEGIWNSVPHSLTGALFPNKQESAFGALRMGQAVGFVIGFVSALFLSIDAQYYIGISFLLIIIITASILFFTTQSKEELFPCCVSSGAKVINIINE